MRVWRYAGEASLDEAQAWVREAEATTTALQARLDALDADLSSRMWVLARRYGYDREPPARPS